MLRAIWPLVRWFRIFRLEWLMRELPAHDMRMPELILERKALEDRKCS